MRELIHSLSLATGQLADPRILRVLAKSLLITLVLLALSGFAGYHLITWLLSGWAQGSLAELAEILTVLLMLFGSWVLFRLVALAVLQFFADEVVHAVEAKHYPASAARARKLAFREELGVSLRSTGRALLANLLALLVAIPLLFTAIGPAIVFWAVNSWLLGRELQDMVWLRHRPDAKSAHPLPKIQRFLLGGVVAGLLVVPFANLLAPVIGAASATHLVHRRRPADNAQ